MEQKKDKGALWMCGEMQQQPLMAGNIGEERALIFKNLDKKDGDNKPEYRVFVEVAGLWPKKDKNGATYLSGTYKGLSIAVFKNTFKNAGDSKPEYTIKISDKISPISQNSKPAHVVMQEARDDEDLPF